MPRGQPSKKVCTKANLPGLRNWVQPSPSPSDPSSHPTSPRSQDPSPDRTDDDSSDIEIDDSDLELLIHFDSLKANYELKGECVDKSEEAEYEEISEWEGFGQEDLTDAMLDMFEDDDEKDLDWLPPKLEARWNKKQNNIKKGRYSPIVLPFTALTTKPAPDKPKNL